jgi:hypothetical protein
VVNAGRPASSAEGIFLEIILLMRKKPGKLQVLDAHQKSAVGELPWQKPTLDFF